LTDEFTFQHLKTEDDLAQHLDLMRTVFGRDSHVDLMVKKWIDHQPGTTLRDFLVAKHQGKIIAGQNLLPLEWSIGGVPLKVAELACVATLPQYRSRGLQRKLMERYHSRISADGYDLSTIEGIPYFYRQFGYEYALPLDEETRINIDQLPKYESTINIHSLVPSDLPRAKQLLAEAQRKLYVHSVRNDGIWKMQENTHMTAEYNFNTYVTEEKGQITAYFRISKNPRNKELYLREVTNVDQQTAQSILRFLRDTGVENGLEVLVSTVSSIEPFTKHLLATGQAKQNLPYAWQIRVLDYSKTLLKMKTLFEERLSSSNSSGLTGSLNFNLYSNTIQIVFGHGKITTIVRLESCEDRAIRFNPQVFVQLLLGYRSREELEATYPDFLVKPSHKQLIDTLFPKMPSFIHTNY